MSVSRGHALVWSAALHTLGIGAAGWTTYGRVREPVATRELHTTRAYALHLLTLTRPKPRAEPRVDPRAARRVAPGPAKPPRPAPSPTPEIALSAAPVVVSRSATRNDEPRMSPLQVRELSPGVVGRAPASAPAAPARPPARGGLDRAASLLTRAGSACPELPLSEGWARRDVAVAVAFEVDASGRVDASKLRVVESPKRQSRGGRFYPRIYVVGARAARTPQRVAPAELDSVATEAVARHVTALEFRPAMSGGRPVSSTVLVACQLSPG